jgi:hypothetical protein
LKGPDYSNFTSDDESEKKYKNKKKVAKDVGDCGNGKREVAGSKKKQ